MQFIANYWWLWLIFSIFCWVYCIFNQLKRMKNIFGSDPFGGIKKGFFSGLASMIIAGLSGSAFGLLLLIAIVLNIISYAKG